MRRGEGKKKSEDEGSRNESVSKVAAGTSIIGTQSTNKDNNKYDDSEGEEEGGREGGRADE